ncbi:hypothetical protein [Pontibacter cellulosilyticus]|uniref:Uncharacterized protein n=1 Tax=Pontibacter cellulosilyticus TaxID=1720253 RepID=A0A923SJY4_9BACT|nr:hypothetical protein [Pontibacter cellulosilyticus]MBC5994162.1 hypothetical protein [Pontibacter cellulosilyticus]
MTRYLLYFLTGFAHALVILIYRGYMGIEPTIYSNIALVSGMVLFGIVSWLKMYLERIGAIMALLCVLAIVPWTIDAGRKVLAYDAFLSGVLLIVQGVLLFFLLATFATSMRYVLSRGSWLTGTSTPGPVGKIIFSAIPIAIIVTWLLIMGKVQ